jgi:uncharacterized protein (TIGR02996 family)
MPRPELTPQGRGLLRDICKEPWRDDYRRIFADCLDDAGHTLRAQYIRDAIALYHKRRADGVKHTGYEDEEAEALTELEEKHWAEWAWPFGDLSEGVWRDCKFSRGFCFRVALPPGTFVEHAAALFRTLPITSAWLRLGRTRVIGDYTHELFDASMTTRGRPANRIPGAIFSYLSQVGLSCTISGSRAVFPYEAYRPPPGLGTLAGRAVARAAVAFGRHAAGLSLLPTERYGD